MASDFKSWRPFLDEALRQAVAEGYQNAVGDGFAMLSGRRGGKTMTLKALCEAVRDKADAPALTPDEQGQTAWVCPRCAYECEAREQQYCACLADVPMERKTIGTGSAGASTREGEDVTRVTTPAEPRPTCACGQECRKPRWIDAFLSVHGATVCVDCFRTHMLKQPRPDLDSRISAALPSEAPRAAWDWDCWSNPGSES